MSEAVVKSNGLDNGFVAYEYLSKEVRRDTLQLYKDSYKNFGWEITEEDAGIFGVGTVKLTMRRNRRLNNRVEITKLQKRCESAMETILRLERQKDSRAQMVALASGVIGTVLMAGATFSYLAANIVLCVVLALPGFIGWGLSYPLYKRTVAKQTVKINAEIDAQYDVIYETCEQGSKLI